MTTGRINQVTTFHAIPRGGGFCIGPGSIPKDTFYPDGSSSTRSSRPTSHFPTISRRPGKEKKTPFPSFDVLQLHLLQVAFARSPCTPISQVSGTLLLVLSRTKITPFEEDYQRSASSKRRTRSRRIPMWLIASGLAIGKQSTSLFVADERFQGAPSDSFRPSKVYTFRKPGKHPSQASIARRASAQALTRS
jgi:hypothetical protein